MGRLMANGDGLPAARLPVAGDSGAGAYDFRPLTREDLPELARLQRRLFPVEYNDAFYQTLLAPDIVTVLAFLDGAMVGVVTGRLRLCHGWFAPYRRGYIITLGVDDRHRRHHLGSQLLLMLHHEFDRQQCASVYLHCKTDNEAALQFYKKHGYAVQRRLPDYYLIDAVHYDAFVLARELGGGGRAPRTLLHAILSFLWACLTRPLSLVLSLRRGKLKTEDRDGDGV